MGRSCRVQRNALNKSLPLPVKVHLLKRQQVYEVGRSRLGYVSQVTRYGDGLGVALDQDDDGDKLLVEGYRAPRKPH